MYQQRVTLGRVRAIDPDLRARLGRLPYPLVAMSVSRSLSAWRECTPGERRGGGAPLRGREAYQEGDSEPASILVFDLPHRQSRALPSLQNLEGALELSVLLKDLLLGETSNLVGDTRLLALLQLGLDIRFDTGIPDRISVRC